MQKKAAASITATSQRLRLTELLPSKKEGAFFKTPLPITSPKSF